MLVWGDETWSGSAREGSVRQDRISRKWTPAKKAMRLAKKGELVPILLLPEIFGGDNLEANVVFVPSFAADLKNSADENIVKPLAAEGRITRYRAEPVYSGKSFVPVALSIHAHDPSDFHHRIAIWGEGLD